MKVGAQIYSLRSLIKNENDLAKAFEFLKNKGAEAVEMVDFEFSSPQLLRKLSESSGIEIGSTHCSFDRLINDTERLVNEHLEYGCRIAGVGCMPLHKYNIACRDGVMKFCHDMNKAAEIASTFGVTVDYHNHAFEFKKVKGERVMDIIIGNTDANVKLCFDMYWARAAGSSVQEYLTRSADKINVLHFKDYKKKFIGSKYMPLGEGTLDLGAIFDLAAASGVEYACVEHDSPRDPLAVIGGGIEYLNALAKEHQSR